MKIFLAFFLAMASLGSLSAEETRRVTMGFILPLTGTAQAWGKHMQNAALLAHESLPVVERSNLELVFEDDQLQSAKGVSAFNKLVERDRISVLAVFGGQSVAAIGPLTQQREIPLFAITANKKLTSGRSFVFGTWLDAEKQVRLLVPLLVKQGVKKIAIVVTSHEAMLDYAVKVQAIAAESGIVTVFQQEYLPGEMDFRGVMPKIRSAGAEAILNLFLPPQMSVFSKQAEHFNLGLPIYGFSNIESASEVKAAGRAMEGVIYTAPRLSTEFLERYQGRFHDFPELASPMVHDAVILVAKAIRDGATSSDAIRESMAATRDFAGAVGTYSCSPANDFTYEPELKIVRDGKFERLGGG